MDENGKQFNFVNNIPGHVSQQKKKGSHTTRSVRENKGKSEHAFPQLWAQIQAALKFGSRKTVRQQSWQ